MPVIIDERVGKVLDELKENKEKRENLRKELIDCVCHPTTKENEERKNKILKRWDEIFEKEDQLRQKYDKLVSQQKDC